MLAKIKNNIFPIIYLLWLIFTVLITFSVSKLSNDNITHIVILIILVLSLFAFKLFKPKNPKRFFIISSVILATLCEGAYMISKPVRESLIITKNSTFIEFIQNYAIDLTFTVPAYILIFFVIWKLINKYNYSTFEYIFLMAFGQALGDGNAFFFANPFMLVFIPYIMLNYHAMNIFPYLKIRDFLKDIPKSNSKWKYPVTVLSLFVTYIFAGGIIHIVAKTIGLE